MPYGILCKGITPQDSMRIPIMAAPRISPFRVVVYITTLKDIPHHYRIFFCFPKRERGQGLRETALRLTADRQRPCRANQKEAGTRIVVSASSRKRGGIIS